MLRVFFCVYSISSLYFVSCTFTPISNFGPLPSENPRCTPDKQLCSTVNIYLGTIFSHFSQLLLLKRNELFFPFLKLPKIK